jgi:putative hemolysin
MKTPKLAIPALLILVAMLLGACAQATPTPAPTSAAIANPASVFCTQHAGKLIIVTAPDGSQTGTCTLPDGQQCEEWAYFRGTCGAATPGAAQGIPPAPGKDDPKAAAQAGTLAMQKLATDLMIDPNTIKVTSTELVTWPDACLGLAAADEMCAQVETPGYRVVLTAGPMNYTYRTDVAGKNIRRQP